MKIKDELTNILSIILDIFEISDTNDITVDDILSKSRKDLHTNGDDDEKIFKDAYLFFFADDDFEGVSKPFKYYKGMKL